MTLTIDEAKAIVSESDTNKDGRISYDGVYKLILYYLTYHNNTMWEF